MASRDRSPQGLYMQPHEVHVLIELLDDKVDELNDRVGRLSKDNHELTRSLSDTMDVANGYWRQLRELRDLCSQHHSAVAVSDVMAVLGEEGE